MATSSRPVHSRCDAAVGKGDLINPSEDGTSATSRPSNSCLLPADGLVGADCACMGSRWRRGPLDGVIGDPPVGALGRRREVGALAVVEGSVRAHDDPPNKAVRCAEAA